MKIPTSKDLERWAEGGPYKHPVYQLCQKPGRISFRQVYEAYRDFGAKTLLEELAKEGTWRYQVSEAAKVYPHQEDPSQEDLRPLFYSLVHEHIRRSASATYALFYEAQLMHPYPALKQLSSPPDAFFPATIS